MARPAHREEAAPLLDVAARLKAWSWAPPHLDKLARELGVTSRSLEALGCVHTPYYDTWGFPMRDGNNKYVGIRVRKINGEKWCEKGSRNGLFIPQTEPEQMALICEGPTDTSAALSLGYWAIGKPNCCGGVDFLISAVRYFGIRRVVIVSDLDDPGLRGATTLSLHLPVPSAVISLPAKDLRQGVRYGINRIMVDDIINQVLFRQPGTST